PLTLPSPPRGEEKKTALLLVPLGRGEKNRPTPGPLGERKKTKPLLFIIASPLLFKGVYPFNQNPFAPL
ncbi:MAG: hypothetical protein WA162_01580, partial [Thermodesulfobacteriota bacterium]